jgi:D-serine deaminase-like pyridoxal phosphate-dependent protein
MSEFWGNLSREDRAEWPVWAIRQRIPRPSRLAVVNLRPETPCLLIDLDRLDANIQAAAAHAAELGIALRPHVKTHKCLEIARRQLGAGAAGVTVATVSEAEVFAAQGCDDLFIAYPLWVNTQRGARLRRLREIATVTVGIDSAEGARALAAQVPGAGVLVEVDSGHHRTGVSPDDAGRLAEAAAHAGLDVHGVFTFPGHSYAPAAAGRVAREERAALTEAAESLCAHGLEPRVVSGGSTPSARHVTEGTMTEMRPGVYVFGDAQQWELGAFSPDRIALSCLATVVSRAGGNVVLDCGSKVLGADWTPWASGYGRLLDHPDARITRLSEHHAVVAWPAHTELPELGSPLRVVPNHVCNAVNLADELLVVHNGAVVDAWRVAARGANR